jgi:hypothetical protein
MSVHVCVASCDAPHLSLLLLLILLLSSAHIHDSEALQIGLLRTVLGSERDIEL